MATSLLFLAKWQGSPSGDVDVRFKDRLPLVHVATKGLGRGRSLCHGTARCYVRHEVPVWQRDANNARHQKYCTNKLMICHVQYGDDL